MRKISLIHVLGLSSMLLTLFSTITNGIFATALDRALPDDCGLVYAGVVLSSISCVVLCLLTFLFTTNAKQKDARFWSSWRSWTLVAMGGLLLGAFVIVVVILRWSDVRLSTDNEMLHQLHAHTMFYVWCGLWATSTFFQIVFYSLILRSIFQVSQQTDNADYCASNNTSNLTHFSSVRKPPISVHSIKSQRHCPTSSRSSQDGGRTSKRSFSESAWSSSEEKIKQPRRQLSLDNRPPIASPERTFDQWDTSSVPFEVHDALFRSSLRCELPDFKYKRSSIKRSASFCVNREGPMLPESPNLNSQSPFVAPWRSISLPQTTTFEENIHPLFRSSNPGRPPSVTPGTRVSVPPGASPIISSSSLHRLRGSVSSPTPLSICEVEPDNHKERAEEDDNDDDEEEEQSSPIPGFILAAGKQNSLRAYGRRKSSVVGDDVC